MVTQGKEQKIGTKDRKEPREITTISELEQTMVAGCRVSGLEPGIVSRPGLPYWPLGKWHSLGSGSEDNLRQFVQRDFIP